ncbi:bifunctional 2-polyprenyl-6-hydroxyphenol methylase/3-demethylubiquinol 3-O-methyltransferase UbiG [Lichenihabitans sp. Uapishka_5]|uniref:bifunctional 2-polyprenyl-6-hydroxyphenol methylase/3-demethylubiquinol 3-O-methyltransferase UbiG n=1 Tax=Lichenihabitans sp. Uapishka_5 TaxID=3037302 RepID=UPI0029E804A8|nr:bifunctional 2-polyprenyl-6-hydroxyphenol methylase/3-demethylubiquinol 3-O-methyltransferase UbiG [Lichenihabitans sp. Uapishka_5]MDX7953194.1 bifunctional 2-polyprenyl-6-hydroxyphenol methylase/3-demethylubiquinol 3-O-methyltransferase UbiG [Lichenihabitans sp. Uapishka_5]
MTSTAAPAAPGFVDTVDLAQFERLGRDWWDARGPMAPLHRLNPTRLRYIRQTVAAHFPQAVGGDTERGTLPLAGLSVLDIGCGGGLLAEPLTRLGARVTAVDPGASNVEVARWHAELGGLTIDYRVATIEDLDQAGAHFDVVIASEVVEHVLDQPAFMATASRLVAPGGLLLASTLNRTAKSFLLAIVGAEYVLGWLPRGTHRWERFVRPSELARWIEAAGLRPIGRAGMVFDPLRDGWRLGRDTDVNYWLAAARQR